MSISHYLLELIVFLLGIATIVGLITRRLRVPYTLGLVIIGILLGIINQWSLFQLPEEFVSIFPVILENITPELILGIFVTPLIFEAAFHLRWENLRRDLVLILALAVPGVILTTILVGSIISVGTNFALPIALVFGALISATDPVSVVALFRTIGVPKRLQVLMEGESLFNDGTAIVISGLVISYAIAAKSGQESFEWVKTITEFIRVAGGGLFVGLLLGFLVSQIISRIDDHLVETTLTSVLAFGAYLVGESIGVSGILSVVAAGLVNGNIGPQGMSPTTRIVVTNFWEYFAFISNSFVFLLIGLEINLLDILNNWKPIALAILAVLIARGVVIYGLTLINRGIPWRWSHVLLWGGLRGAISLALVLSLPASLGVIEVEGLKVMTFGVVLFTLLVQGFSMQGLVKRMHLVERSAMQEEYERRHARAVAARASYDHLLHMYKEGLFSDHTWQKLSPLLKRHSETLVEDVKEVMREDPIVEAEELDTARREGLRAQRSALIGLLKDGVISEEVYSQLARSVDLELSSTPSPGTDLSRIKSISQIPVEILMTAVVQVHDVEKAINALHGKGFMVSRLYSRGGFLGRKNVTLLIGSPKGKEEAVVRLLNKNCRRRVEYVSTPLEGAPIPLPLATPVAVGGATIFTIEVDRYEEI